MQKLQIPKKSGGKRTIYIQGNQDKSFYRMLGYELSQHYIKNEAKPELAHGFVSGRSPVSNALKHVDKKYTLTIDLKDFFDTVTETHLTRAGVDLITAKSVCYDGATRQGLSSSPAAANVAAIPLDKEILGVLDKLCNNAIYTRYADDLTFSSDSLDDLLKLRDNLPLIVEKHGFKINSKKTRIQSADFGRRIITGVAVDIKIHPTKKQKKRLRAGKHNLHKLNNLLYLLISSNQLKWFAIILEINRKQIFKYYGLKEWCKQKLPTQNCLGKWFTTHCKIQTEAAFGEFCEATR